MSCTKYLSQEAADGIKMVAGQMTRLPAGGKKALDKSVSRCDGDRLVADDVGFPNNEQAPCAEMLISFVDEGWQQPR